MRKTSKMRFYVGKCDIAKGIKCDHEECGIAQSLKRRFPKSKIQVFEDEVEIGNTRYDLCDIGKQFIQDFDYDKDSVKPCHYMLYKV